jgi:hypothetical protein
MNAARMNGNKTLLLWPNKYVDAAGWRNSQLGTLKASARSGPLFFAFLNVLPKISGNAKLAFSGFFYAPWPKYHPPHMVLSKKIR